MIEHFRMCYKEKQAIRTALYKLNVLHVKANTKGTARVRMNDKAK